MTKFVMDNGEVFFDDITLAGISDNLIRSDGMTVSLTGDYHTLINWDHVIYVQEKASVNG